MNLKRKIKRWNFLARINSYSFFQDAALPAQQMPDCNNSRMSIESFKSNEKDRMIRNPISRELAMDSQNRLRKCRRKAGA